MRRLKLSVACSLDGYIAGANEAVDWIRMDADYGMEAFFQSVDAALIGRRTFEFAGGKRMPFSSGMTNYVFSNTLRPGRHAGVEVVAGDAAEFTRALKQKAGRDIWLLGGHALAASLLGARLVDEIGLAVHPVLLGGGTPLFAPMAERQQMVLRSTQAHPNGVVQLRYDCVG